MTGILYGTMKRLAVLSLLTVLCSSALNAQSTGEIISSLRLDELSVPGQDTISHYYRIAFDELFAGSMRTRNPLTVPEEKEVLVHFFRDKLSTTDLEVLRQSWAGKYEDFQERTLVRAEAYQVALDCQRTLLDSIRRVFASDLSRFQQEVLSALEKEQIEALDDCYRQSIDRLHRKRDEFLQHEERFTRPTSSTIYDYFAFSFRLMEEVPASYYYSLVGAKNERLAFAEELSLEAYYEAYASFERAVIQALEQEGCRAHLTLPAYHEGARYQGKHTKRNALFYALRNWYSP